MNICEFIIKLLTNPATLVAFSSITAGLIGAIIPSYFSYKNNKDTIRQTENLKNKEIKINEYRNFLFQLQSVMNKPLDKAEFYKLQNSINTIFLYGNDETSKNISIYYNKMIELQNNTKGLSPEEHKNYQNKIINSMRRDLNFSTEEIKDIHLTAFRF